MTWVIGRAGPFGNAIAISDICVTLDDGSEKDCLQKIYKIGSQLVLGFAGLVPIGFEIVNQLSKALDSVDKYGAWHPERVAELLPIGAKEIYDSFQYDLNNKDCHLLLLGVDPTENEEPTPLAKCYAFRFYSPMFEPIQANTGEIVSIGSGSGIDPYVQALNKLATDLDVFKLEVGFPGGAGIGLIPLLSKVLNEISVPGISRYLQICIVERDRIRIGNNENFVNDPIDSRNEIPQIATTMKELERILKIRDTAKINGLKC